MTRFDRPVMRIAIPAMLATVLLSVVTGCGHMPQMHWPWHHKAAPPPQEVHELVITSADGSTTAFPQYWRQNTLVVDLQSASGSGNVVLKPREHTLWPVRIAFRVMPGQIGALEVRANQRVVLPITAAGTKPVDLELAPGVFIMKTPEMTVLWGPAIQSSGS
jgi:hypothetical protein